jgi:hypothetical protein
MIVTEVSVSTISTAEPRFRSALDACVSALRRLAGYELDPGIARQLQGLSERKEFLDPAQHDELLALVSFSQQRAVEKLEAQAALKRLRELFPDVVDRN